MLSAVPLGVRKSLHAPPAGSPTPAPPRSLFSLPPPPPGTLFLLLGGEGALPPRQAEVAVAVGVRDELEPQNHGGEKVREAEDGRALGNPDRNHGDREAEEDVGAVQQQDRPLFFRVFLLACCFVCSKLCKLDTKRQTKYGRHMYVDPIVISVVFGDANDVAQERGRGGRGGEGGVEPWPQGDHRAGPRGVAMERYKNGVTGCSANLTLCI